jgi:hypothetical protein
MYGDARMLTQSTKAGFQTTRWTLIDALQDKGTARDDALDALVSCYWPPVYARLRRKGCDADESAEITQAFFADVVLGRRLFERANQEVGRLRTLMLTALDRYLVDCHRRRCARADGFAISMDKFRREEAALSGDSTADPDEAFERRWATAMLDAALQRCEAHYRGSGRAGHWEAFERHVLRPAIAQTSPAMYRTLASELGFNTPADAAAAVQVVKRRALSMLREVVAETTRTSEDAEDEFSHIKDLLS